MSLANDILNSSLVCRLCIKRSDSFHPIDYIRKPLESILPNIELSLTNEPVVVCSNCVTSTTLCYTFITMCLEKNRVIQDHYNKVNFKTVDLNFLHRNSKSSIKPCTKIKHDLKNTSDWVFDYTCTVSVEKNEQNNLTAIKDYQDRLSKSIGLQNGNIELESTVTVEKKNENKLKTKKEYDLLLKTSKNNIIHQELESSDIIEIFESDIISDDELDISEVKPFKESFRHNIVGPENNNNTEESKKSDCILITDSENELEDDDDLDDNDMKFVEEFDFSRVQNISTVNTNKLYTADEVNQSLPNENFLDVLKSQQLQKSDSVFTCLICHKNFSQKLNLNGHLLTKHRDIPDLEKIVTSKIHYCQKCPYRTINTFNLAQHLKNKHNKKSVSFSKKFRDSVFTCLICHKNFSQKLNLNGHLLTKHRDIPDLEKIVTSKIHYCQKCPYRTINTFNLAQHLKNKHNKKSVSFSKKFLCAHCKYCTNNKGNLITHLKIHNVLRDFRCEYCEKSFNQKGQLQTHILRYHADVPFFK